MSLFNHDFKHQKAVDALVGAAPPSTRASLNDIWQAAMGANIPWLKIMMAFATAAAGGFSPAAIAAAIAMLFSANPPANLAHLVGPKMTSTVAPTS